MMKNRLDILGEFDSPVSMRELKHGLRVEVCWEYLANSVKARSQGIFNGVGWGFRHLCSLLNESGQAGDFLL